MPGQNIHAKLKELQAKRLRESLLHLFLYSHTYQVMIKLTKMNGQVCLLNHALIEIIEESPDTCITMSNGNRYLIIESGEEIREKIIAFNVEILQRAGYNTSLVKPTAE